MDDSIISLADKIISILKQKKIIELSELVKQTGASEHDIKEIINLLEKEEMVDVGYSLTKVLISWNDEADRILMKMKKNQKIVSLEPHETAELINKKNGKAIKSQAVEKSNEKVLNKLPEFNILREKPNSEIKKIHQVSSNLKSRKNTEKNSDGKDKITTQNLNEFKRSTRESSYNIGPMAIKDQETNDDNFDDELEEETFNILDSKVEDILTHRDKTHKNQSALEIEKEHKSKSRKQPAAQGKKTEIDREVKELEKNILVRLFGEDPNGDSTQIISLRDSDIVKKAKEGSTSRLEETNKKRLLGKYRSSSMEINQRDIENDSELIRELQEKLKQIANKRIEIAELNKQKTILFDSVQPELKSKLSAQIDAMRDIMNEKQNKLQNLRDKIQTLPEDINEINLILKSFIEKQKELDNLFESSLREINEIRKRIKEEKLNYIDEFNLIRNKIIDQEKELTKVNDIYSTIKEREEKLMNSISILKDNISKSKEDLVNLEGELDKIRSSSKAIEMKIDESNKILKSLNKQFEDYVSKLNNLNHFDSKLKAIQSEYIASKEKIDSRIKEYRSDALALAKSIELEASNRYLQEIAQMTADTENSFISLLSDEKEINKSINEKKQELANLIQEAKELQNYLHQNNLSLGSGLDNKLGGYGLQDVGKESGTSESNVSFYENKNKFMLSETNSDFDVKVLDFTDISNQKSVPMSSKVIDIAQSKTAEIKNAIKKLMADVNIKINKKN